MRLAQGKVDSAAATIRRAVSESSRGLPRVALLPASRSCWRPGTSTRAGACRELDDIAAQQGSEAISAMSWHARGAVCLAEGDAQAALVALRRAWQAWHELEAPYDAARTRTLVGRACRLVGDEDSAALELQATRDAFSELGAQPDLTTLEPLAAAKDTGDVHGLSAREREVLRLVATGQSTREIAAALVVSEHTVARHLQNIFAKLGVSSRTAATAFAYEHDLV